MLWQKLLTNTPECFSAGVCRDCKTQTLAVHACIDESYQKCRALVDGREGHGMVLLFLFSMISLN